MSSNEIVNHIEASCWLKWIEPTEVPGIVPPPLYFRSQSGFLDVIGVSDPSDPTATPVCLLQLDRYYTRREVSIICYPAHTVDLVEAPPAAPTLIPIPPTDAVLATPNVLPIDSRLVYGEVVPPPVTPEEVAPYYETFNALIVSNVNLTGGEGPEAIQSDLCILLVRVPRQSSGPNTVTYRAISF